MSDDYLWDRSGPADAEIRQLEQLLAPLAARSIPPFTPPLVQRPLAAAQLSFRTRATVLALAAALVLAIAGLLFSLRHPEPATAWTVAGVAGATTLRQGQWLHTGAGETASIAVADIGRVEVDPNSRVRLLRSRAGDHRLEMSRGTLHAVIWAPPGQFFVETPAATAIDLGCAYTLTVGEDGSGVVNVTSGWVGFEWRGREAFIPAGSMALTRPGVGPGTPFVEAASPSFRAALAITDFSGEARQRQAALRQVIAESTAADAVTLWHLLDRGDATERDAVFTALARVAPPPPGVTRAGIAAGDRAMRDAWWDGLGLGTAAWWRTWKQPWQDNKGR